MNAVLRSAPYRAACALLVCGAGLGLCAVEARADGTEILGPPSLPPLAPGTHIVGAGVGTFNGPGVINLNLPLGVTIKQVLLYWEGFADSPATGDNSINVNGVPVLGQLIGGPTLFFAAPFQAWAHAYRADITALSFANNWFDPIPATFAIDGFDFASADNGAGILVIYDDGTPPAQIALRDGSDLAFRNFAPPLNATVPQTFNFAPAGFDRQADVVLFVASVDVNVGSVIRITTGGNVTNIVDLLGNTDGPQWDTVSSSVVVPAGANSITFEIISGPGAGPPFPASLDWLCASFAILPGPINGTVVINKITVPPGGAGFQFNGNVGFPNFFALNHGGSQVYNNVLPGSYSVTETDPAAFPGGYNLTSVTCVDSDGGGIPSTGNVATRTATINVDSGETVTCTFVNSQPPPPSDCRMSNSEKGSLLIFSKVDLRWNTSGQLIQDTFLDLTNDYPEDVCVQMYFINGDPPLAATPTERFHPGWNWADVEICLTANQPTFWSAATGLPATGGVSPFTILDPGVPPGRPDPEGSGDRILRGYIVGWAVNSVGEEIRWNHLKGDAVIVNYALGSAWEYTAWASQAINVVHGAVTGTPGVLNLDGVEYCPPYELLLLDFYATGAQAFSRDGSPIELNTDLTLFPVSADLRQETDGPVTTKASFTIWNQNEVKFTGLDLCITCWDQRLFTSYGVPNHFLRENLQTNKGKAQIDGLASQLCNFDYDQGDGLPLGADPRDIVSERAAILGVVAKYMRFVASGENEIAGMNLIGLGRENAVIQADIQGVPPPERPVEEVIVPESQIDTIGSRRNQGATNGAR